MEVSMMRLMRLEKRMTMKEAGAMLGISESYFCLLEQGRRKPSNRLLEKMEKFYGMAFRNLMRKKKIGVRPMPK